MMPASAQDDAKIVRRIVAALLAAVLVGFLLVYRIYDLPASAMQPSLRDGDLLVAFRLPYARRIGRDLGRFDIAVFRNPDDPKRLEVRRVVGIPRDLFEFRDAKLFINRDPVIEGDAMYDAFRPPEGSALRVLDASRDNYGPVQIPKRKYFVMGDNRDHSVDSRKWGLLPHRLFVARVIAVIAIGGDEPPPLPPK